MADIFEIVGRFAIDGADKAKRDIDDVTKTGERSSSALGKFGKVMGTVGKGVLAVGGAVSAGSVALVKSVQSSYGELQQNLGGSEAVYGQYASNIQEIAKDAYKNMGMSQSEYLATANKMGSLFQGSGIAQKEALDMTTKAMQRASDVASVMGIDMSMAMESIAGAAKGNFTMMDNLGVAMNATTLESYALSKGMTDFSWNSASSAEKNALAMQMFLERTEQYAGNFARESTDTISGSIGYLGAAWDDFKAGLGNPTADMARLTNNLASSFGAMINNIVPIIENIANALPIVLPSIVDAISNLAPTLIQTFTEVITKMIDAIIPLLPTVIPLFVDMLVKIGMALAQNAPLLIDGFVQLITQLTVAITQNLPTLIPIFIDCLVQIAGAIAKNAPIILDAILGIGANFESGLSPAISACIGLVEVLTGAFIAFKAGAMIQSVVQGFQSAQVALALFKMETQGASIAQGLLNGQLSIGQTVVGLLTGQVTLAEIATGLWSKAQGVLNAVMSMNPIALVVMAIGALVAGVIVAYQKCDWFREMINNLGTTIYNAFNAVVEFFKNNWQSLLLMIVNPFAGAFKLLYDNCEGFRNFINGLGESIKNGFTAVIEWFKKLPQTVSNAVKSMITFISQLPNKIAYNLGLIIGKVVKFAIEFPSKAKEAGKNFINNLINFIKELPNKVKTWLTNTISNVATFVTNFVNNAKTAGVSFVTNLISFIKSLPGNIWNWLCNVISNVATFVLNFANKAIEAGTRFFNNIVNGVKELPGKMLSIGKDIISGIWDGISSSWDWIKQKITEWCGSFIQGFKDALGIHSPSRVMRDSIGKPIVDGVVVGIKENSKEVPKAFQKMLDDLQLKRDLDIINDAEYYKELEHIRDKYLEKGTKDWWQYTQEIISYENNLAEQEEETRKENVQKLFDDLEYQRDMDLISESEYYSKMGELRDIYLENGSEDWKSYTKEIHDFEKQQVEDLDSLYDEHLKNREELTSNFYNKISSSKLYTNWKITMKDKTMSGVSLNDWEYDIKELDELENKLSNVQERLKVVFAGDDESLKTMLDTIRSDPLGEGGKVLDAMFKASDEQLNKFASGYKTYIEKSKSITSNVYADDIEELDKNFIQKVSEKFANSPLLENLKNLGENVTESLMSGIDSKSDWLKEQIVKFCSKISDTFSLGFSTVAFENTDINTLGNRSDFSNYKTDYTEQLNLINDAFDRLIGLVGKYLPSIDNKVDRSIVVDGDSLAVGISRKMDSQLGKMSVAKSRGNV